MPRIFDFEILMDLHVLTCAESILTIFEMMSVCMDGCMDVCVDVNLSDISRTEQHLKLKCFYKLLVTFVGFDCILLIFG